MKNNKVLAVALSAGLVLGGAYALDANNNVAYAAEPSATKAELEKQIADAKSQRLELDKKKAQCNNAINYRAGLRKSDDLSDEKLNEYDQLDAKDRAEIEELDKKIAVIDQTIANLKAQLNAADKKDEEPKEKPEDSSEEVEWNGYDDDYNREWKDASREQDEKLAKEKSEESSEEETEWNGYDDEYTRKWAEASRKQDEELAKKKSEESSEEETEWNGYDDEYTRKWAEASREQDKKIAEAKLNEAKSAAKAIVDSNVEAKNITKEEGESYKTRIDAANSKEEINAILKEIYNKYKGEKEEFIIKGHIYRPYESKSFADFTIDSKNYDNDFSKTVSAAYDYVNTAYGTKYRVEVADGGYTLNFHLLEEEIALTPLEPSEEIEKETPWSPLVPAKKHDTDITPNPGHVIIPSETIEDETTEPSEDKPSVDRDKEQEAKDLTDKLNKITKEIEDTLIENEKNIDDKKPSEEEKPSNEKPSEEKPAKENKPTAGENKVEKKVVAKKVAKHDNPKTGVVAMSSVVSTLAISMAGIVATRKKND